ncbi:MAG: hypothetical protein A2X61_11485 [Ignavibacteria bacterium GWB2_35_12]|nr:MAG: hypothetical protein A2X61_11485 [Ignavibacteria bacterium GWB2_35_12]OGU86322.1 MAG: hypothetical protein A2220_15165 [Ignavibacteria bacterium RIFOXYA2_FULL_35_10]OGV20088.1 MAG: hypothetical protein A2475_05740 [Ignavibacteria bacterium RIFOXYC2_FULL_35_21]
MKGFIMLKSIKIIIFFSLCLLMYIKLIGKQEIKAPIPDKKLTVSEELKYIFNTDHKDREYLFDSTKTFSGSQDINDSIRLSRIIELDTNHLINSNIDKYYAAIIYNHCGGSKMKDDSIFYLRAIDLCNDILNSDTNEYMSDTLSLKIFNEEMEKFKIFRQLFFESTKVDTLIDSKSNDTMLVINKPIKERAIGLKQIAESGFKSQFVEKNESINLNDIDNPEYLKKVKEKLRAKLIKSMEEKSPTFLKLLSDEQIDKLVEENLQSLINYKRSLLEDIKNNPEKYKDNKK